jgi:hypothetical protein
MFSYHNLIPRIALCLLVLFSLPTLSAEAKRMQPLSLHPENPHYFLFRNKPTVLITSAGHYGQVLNMAFESAPYLDELHAHGLNYTRIFTGVYVEDNKAFNIADNILAPLPRRLIAPWARSETPGYANGGNKFDLNRWDPVYFERLKGFVRDAGKRGIVVEVSLFCPYYEETMWNLSPLNVQNNVNGVGNANRTDVLTMKHPELVKIEEAMTRKFVEELNEFDNVFFEICNEPYFGGVTLDWQAHIAQTIADAEAKLPNKHLIAQNINNGREKIENPNPRVSIFNFHYAHPPDTVAMNYGLNKVIGDDETGFRGVEDVHYRTEAWDFILAGGGLYNNLDYSFTVDHEKGDFDYPNSQPGGGTLALRKQLSILKRFMEGFDFLRMKPDAAVMTGGTPEGATVRALSLPGRAYAIYVNGGAQANLELALPPGRYQAEWLDTKTGRVVKKEEADSSGHATLSSPPYSEDIALSVKSR